MATATHENCDSFQDNGEVTEFQMKFREAPICANDGKYEQCETCPARVWASKPPHWKYGRNNRTSPL